MSEIAALRGAPDAPGVKDCCKDPANLVQSVPRADVTIDTCSVCGCRHFRAQIDPGKLLGRVGPTAQ